jgi:hypothetical protein
MDNYFDGAGVSAKSVKGLTVTGNSSPGGNIQIRQDPTCTGTKVENNDSKKGTP